MKTVNANRSSRIMKLLAIIFSMFSVEYAFAMDIPRVEKYVLDNGMTFLLLPRESSSISFDVKVKVGSIDEKEGKTGLSHMLEHMMFKGTETIGTIDYRSEKKLLDEMDVMADKIAVARPDERDALMKRLAELQNQAAKLQVPGEFDKICSLAGGIGLNAYTSADLTSYHVTLPCDRLEFWASLESGRMQHPVFREFYTERDVVLKERSQRTDLSDEGILYEKFLLHAFEASPYRNPIIGFRNDVEKLTRKDLENYYYSYYVPENVVVAIAGGFDTEKVKSILNKYFGPIPAGKRPAPPFSDEPAKKACVRVKVSSKEQPSMIMGVLKPRLPDIDDTCFDIISEVLTGGETSRLVAALVKTGIASGVSSYNGLPGSRLDNLFIISASPIKPHTNRKIEDIIWKEIDALNKEGITADEMARAVRVIKKSVLSSMETDAGAASVLSLYEVVAGDWRYIYSNLSILETLKPEQVRDCAREYLIRSSSTTGLMEE